MNSRNTKPGLPRRSVARAGTCADPELTIQERSNPLAWFVFHTVAFWSAASFWLRYKRICAWHQPQPLRMGGSPLARRSTHGLCPECFARISAEIISHGETGLCVSGTKNKNPAGSSLPAPPARNCAAPAWLQRPAPATRTRTGEHFSVGKTFNQ